MENIKNKKVLLIICGGIAAYKSLELIRLLKKNGSNVKTILTKSAKKFVTPLQEGVGTSIAPSPNPADSAAAVGGF